MPKVVLPIANGFYQSKSLPISAQECLNWFPRVIDAVPALSQEVLFGVPGKTQLGTTGDLEVNRGSHKLAGVPYFVNGTTLYRCGEDGTTTSLGVIEGSGRVSMDENGTQLCIMVPGGKGYIFTADPDTLTEITDADFRANGDPQHVRFIDGYFVFTTDSKKFIVSALNDGLAYNALDFGSAEANPDDTVAPFVFQNQLFIAGSVTIEAFQNIGSADFPFQRSGLFIEVGVKAPFSLVKTKDAIMFIGNGHNEAASIWATNGGKPERVSTDAIDSILQGFTDTEIADAFSWTYAQEGGYFVAFSLPTTTLVLDTVSGRWHERKSQIVNARNETKLIRDRVNSLVSAYGKLLVGDSQDGRIGVLDPDVYKEYDRDFIRRVASQPFQNNMESFSVPEIELTMEAGVGNGDVADPVVRMDRSVNGGKTFTYERSRKMGKIGDYKRRTIWRRNGRASRYEIFRFTLSDAVKPVIIQLTADIVG